MDCRNFFAWFLHPVGGGPSCPLRVDGARGGEKLRSPKKIYCSAAAFLCKDTHISFEVVVVLAVYSLLLYISTTTIICIVLVSVVYMLCYVGLRIVMHTPISTDLLYFFPGEGNKAIVFEFSSLT